jgi:DNA replication protein DnaC
MESTIIIEDLLHQLRLSGMAQHWQGMLQTRSFQQLSVPEALQTLLESEALHRQQRKVVRLNKAAQFRYTASMAEITYLQHRGLDKNTLSVLAGGAYITDGNAVLITGPTGSGKSYVASALGNHACSQGRKVSYYNMQKLLQRFTLARADGSILSLLDKISRHHVLILDDFGLKPLDKQQRLDLLDIIEDRHQRCATIMVSQLPVESWYDVIGESTVADAILDRLIHTAYRIELKGESMRKKL